MIHKYKELWIPFLCFFLIMLLLLFNIALPIDLWVYHLLKPLIQEPLISIMKAITFLGEPKTIAFCSLLFIIYLVRNNRKEIKPFLILLIISVIFIVFLKLIFVRERPNILRLIPIDGYSFPSGHSIISVSFYGYFTTYLLEHYKLNFAIISILLILGIGLSRIFLGVHYFSDVLAGYSLGFLSLGITNLLRRKEP